MGSSSHLGHDNEYGTVAFCDGRYKQEMLILPVNLEVDYLFIL